MSQTEPIHYIYAIQYIRSHLQTLIETDTKKVDQELAELLEQLKAGQDITDQFRQILTPNPKARSWWVELNQTLSGNAPVTKGISGSSAADGFLHGSSNPDLLPITCKKCDFVNLLLSWDDSIPCQNSDRPKHYIEL